MVLRTTIIAVSKPRSLLITEIEDNIVGKQQKSRSSWNINYIKGYAAYKKQTV